MKNPDCLKTVGIIVGVCRSSVPELAKEVLSQPLPDKDGEVSWVTKTLEAVSIDFTRRGTPDPGESVKQLRKVLPESLIMGVGLDNEPTVRMFAMGGGEIYSTYDNSVKGPVADAHPLFYAYNCATIGRMAYKLYPNCGINMVEAVENWTRDFGCCLIPCYRGIEQFGEIWGCNQRIRRLAQAGAVAIEVWLEDAIAFTSQHPTVGGPELSPLGKIAQIKREFLLYR